MGAMRISNDRPMPFRTLDFSIIASDGTHFPLALFAGMGKSPNKTKETHG
jgi:hypothetical protein